MAARAAIAAALVALMTVPPSSRAVVVQPGENVAAAARAAHTVVLARGVHAGFVLDRPVAVLGAPGALVAGEIRIVSDGVTLRDLTIAGGENGITVRDAGGIRIERVSILSATLHGIEINDGQAVIDGCRISGLGSPFAQGIEVRNVVDRPGTLVRGCSVTGGQEGIVSHAARVEYRENVISGTTMRGLAVTEMSEGLVAGNLVHDVTGSGLYCGDMAHCEFRGNVVRGVRSDGTGVRTTSGYGVVAWYYSTFRDDTTVVGAAGPDIGVIIGSKLTDRFPLGTWPRGWSAAAPGLAATGLAIAALFAIARLARPLARALPAPRDGGTRAGALLAWGFGVQTFHMLEHGVQVVQAKVVNGSQRQGLLGAHVDAEWMHLAYNTIVLAFLGWALAAAIPRTLPRARAILFAAAIVQTFHLVEHGFKVAQHAASGVNPAPGLVGGRVGDLIWFHFGINAVVYAGLAAVVAVLAMQRMHRRPRAARRAPAAA